MRRLFMVRLIRSLVMITCSVAFLAGPIAASPRVALAAGCPSLPLSVGELVAMQRQNGPLAKAFALGVTPMNERALACFGGRELVVSAFVNQPDGVGGTTSFSIMPTWIVAGSLFVFASSREVAPGYGDGPFTSISVRPSLGNLQRRYARHWVTIRGHFDDPAAATCKASGPKGVTPTRAQAIAICQTMFVVTSIRTSGAPDTATAATVATVPVLGSAVPWLIGLVWFVGGVLARRRKHRLHRWVQVPRPLNRP
jgi:hypothetical protein